MCCVSFTARTFEHMRLSMCIIVYSLLCVCVSLSAFNASRVSVQKEACLSVGVYVHATSVLVHLPSAERLVRPERPGVMSDARGGFLPTSH